MAQQEPIKFSISTDSFDLSLLPPAARKVGSDVFAEGIKDYYQEQFKPLGGRVYVDVTGDAINVTWEPEGSPADLLDQALALLNAGKLAEAVPLLEALLAVDPDDPVVLYNLGMALSDIGNLDRAIQHLQHAVEVSPGHTNALVALGVALQRSGDRSEARRYLEEATGLDPDNPFAQRNLGAVLASEGSLQEAEKHLRTAYQLMPDDQAAVYGLAQCLHRLGGQERLSEADDLYQKAINLRPNSQIGELSRRALTEMAQQGFKGKSEGLRMDAVMYCVGALQKLEDMTESQIRNLAAEIALMGRRGLDVNNPEQKYTLRSLPGRYSGLHLVCLMYTAFRRIAPDQDIGFDLSREYAAAQDLHGGTNESG